jgi:predicted ribosomally synthesized peptide with nif11-like leader
MSVSEIERFFKDIDTSRELEELMNSAEGSVDKLAELVKAKGYDFSAEEAKAHFSAPQSDELEDWELDSVAGGVNIAVWRRQHS